jgi:hypothetical protein
MRSKNMFENFESTVRIEQSIGLSGENLCFQVNGKLVDVFEDGRRLFILSFTDEGFNECETCLPAVGNGLESRPESIYYY